MSTHERKVRKRSGIPFVRVSPTCRSFSADEWEQVTRFGFDTPGDDSFDDVEGMTFGVRLALVALIGGSVLVLMMLVLVIGVVASR